MTDDSSSLACMAWKRRARYIGTCAPQKQALDANMQGICFEGGRLPFTPDEDSSHKGPSQETLLSYAIIGAFSHIMLF